VSDTNTFIIPTDPGFVPTKKAAAGAVAVLRKLAPKADEIEAIIDEHVTFRSCGESFDAVRCPACHTEIDVDRWHEWMDADCADDAGFRLRPIAMPCCKRSFTLADLAYEEPQGFSRFALRALNPNKDFAKAALAKLEAALGCKVRVIHERI